MAALRKRTIRLFRIEDDGRRLLAGTLQARSPAELVVLWRVFPATAPVAPYVAHYRGDTMGLEAADEAAYAALAA